VLVDDQRAGLRHLLATARTFAVVGEAGDARGPCAQLEAVEHDLAVVDISLPGSNGIALLRELSRRRERRPALILTMHQHADFVVDAFAAGAKGYALKRQSPWWEEYSGPGWERAVQCGAKEEVPKHAKPPKAGEVYGGIKTTPTGSTSGVSSQGQATATGAGTGSGTAPSGAPGAAVSDVARSRAGRLRSPFALLWW